MAKKDDAFFAYRVASPRHLLRCRNAFSTKWRIGYQYRSYARRGLRLFFGGMTGVMPRFSAPERMASVSYALSPKSMSAWKPSVRGSACVQSPTVPAVTRTRSGRPCASTAKWILVLSPLLCGSSPRSLPSRRRHADELSRDWHQ